jgi:hypothetical protein
MTRQIDTQKKDRKKIMIQVTRETFTVVQGTNLGGETSDDEERAPGVPNGRSTEEERSPSGVPKGFICSACFLSDYILVKSILIITFRSNKRMNNDRIAKLCVFPIKKKIAQFLGNLPSCCSYSSSSVYLSCPSYQVAKKSRNHRY